MHLFFKSKAYLIGICILFLIVGLLYFFLHKNHSTAAPEELIKQQYISQKLDLKEDGIIHILHAVKPEKGLLLYIADKSTTSAGYASESYADKFAALSYYVAIIDQKSLLDSPANTTAGCLNLAKKLSHINDQLHAQFNINNNELPLLVGSDASSAVVYAALSQVKKRIFHAAVSINFSPQLKISTPLCEQEHFSQNISQQLQLTAVKHLSTSFYIFQKSSSDAHLAGHNFTDGIGNIKLTISDNNKQTETTKTTEVTEAIQVLQWLDPRLSDQISSDTGNNNLPLIEVPAVNITTNTTTSNDKQHNIEDSTENENDVMAVMITGDGGWAEIDKNIAKILSEKGIPVVALDSLSYFWKARTAAETSKDIETTINQYSEKWNKNKIILIGYSFGADVLPFVANNLTKETQSNISLVALLGMGKTAAFEFHLSSWLDADKNTDRLPLLPEIEKMTWANSVCIYGVSDTDANCQPTAEFGVKVISMIGDHHFNEKFDELAQHIIDNIKHN